MHTMIRVFDLDKSIDFYTELLGMTFCAGTTIRAENSPMPFVGYGPEEPIRSSS